MYLDTLLIAKIKVNRPTHDGLYDSMRLLKDIETNGQELPIVVSGGDPYGNHCLIDGYDRLISCRAAGRKTILCIVKPFSQEEDILLQMYKMKNDHRKLTPKEHFAIIQELLIKGKELKHIRKSANMTTYRYRQVNEYLQAPEDLKNDADTYGLSIKQVKMINEAKLHLSVRKQILENLHMKTLHKGPISTYAITAQVDDFQLLDDASQLHAIKQGALAIKYSIERAREIVFSIILEKFFSKKAISYMTTSMENAVITFTKALDDYGKKLTEDDILHYKEVATRCITMLNTVLNIPANPCKSKRPTSASTYRFNFKDNAANPPH